MTREEKIICKELLNDADKTHSCNEYKLLMNLIEQEPTTKNETLVSLEVYKQVAWERDIAIEQLHELGYEFGQKIEPTTKNDLGVDCVSREKAIEEADKLCLETGYDNEKVIEMLNDLPSVTPQEPIEKCKWIKYDHRTMCPKEHMDVDSPYWRIPENRMETLKYCPYCGKEIEVEE